MAQMWFKSTGAPSTTPSLVGQICVDETNDVVYISTDTASSSDWTKASQLTNAQVKTAYEANADTNAFTDALSTKLGNIATAATANDTDANLKARANHTGTQLKSTISDFAHTQSSHTADTLANLNAKVSDGTLIDTGDSRLSDSRPCDDTFDTAATARTNLDVYSTSEVDGKVAGLYENKGAYDASTNTPDLDTSPSGVKNGDAYTVSVAGNFFTEAVEPGDILIASQDDPTLLTHWARTNKNISFGTTTGTACEGDDSRLSDNRTDATAIHDATSSEISAITEKTTPVSGDFLLIEDSAASNAKKRVQVGNLPSSGGGKNDINFSYATTTGDFIEGAGTATYQKVDTFEFRGSTALGTPVEIRAQSSSTTTDHYQVRIYDVTNSLVIAESAETGDISGIVSLDLTSIANVPTGRATWELQFKEVPSSNGKYRCHFLGIWF